MAGNAVWLCSGFPIKKTPQSFLFATILIDYCVFRAVLSCRSSWCRRTGVTYLWSAWPSALRSWAFPPSLLPYSTICRPDSWMVRKHFIVIFLHCHFYAVKHAWTVSCISSIVFCPQSRVACVRESPIIWQLSKMFSVQRFRCCPRCLFLWTRTYRVRCGHREGCIRTTWPKSLRWWLWILTTMSYWVLSWFLIFCSNHNNHCYSAHLQHLGR